MKRDKGGQAGREAGVRSKRELGKRGVKREIVVEGRENERETMSQTERVQR